MKIQDLYESEWDLGGGWITSDGEWLENDHTKDLHHSDIALLHNIEHMKDTDEYYHEHGEFDKYSKEYAETICHDAGWIRITTASIKKTFDVQMYRHSLNKDQFKILKRLVMKHAKLKYKFGLYIEFDYFNNLSAAEFMRTFNSMFEIY